MSTTQIPGYPRIRRARPWTGLPIFLLLVSVCGAGIDRTGVANRFDSVIVNGIELETDNTTVLLDGQPATPLDLSPGQYIRLREGANGEAEHIEMDTAVRGGITFADPGANELRILEQTIHLDGRTVLEGITATELVAGGHASINGIRDENGELVAAWIGPAASNDLLLRGEVQSLDPGAARASIGGQAIDFSTAQLDGFPTGMLELGQRVLVRGETLASGTLMAEMVSHAYSAVAIVGENVSLEGFVSTSGASEFSLGSTLVSLQSGTIFDEGDAGDLVPGARVVVDGYQTGPSTLDADRVTIKYQADTVVAGEINAINQAAGTLSVLHLTVVANELTTLADQSALALHFFEFEDLRVGDHVEVRGALHGPDLHTAVLIRTRNYGSFAMTGTASKAPNQQLRVLGTLVKLCSGDEDDDSDEGGASISVSSFRNQVHGNRVLVEGQGSQFPLAVTSATILDSGVSIALSGACDDDDDDDDEDDD